jgi:hypothetical protein
MWTVVKTAPNLMLAEMWKEFFEGEGIPTQILPVTGEAPGRELVAYRVLVPEDKRHLIEEILKTL